MLAAIKETVEYIRSMTSSRPTIGIVLGSGLGRLTDDLEIVHEIPYSDIPHFPVSTVQGHLGALSVGYLAGKEVWVMKGRFHYYEGYSMKEVTFPIRVMQLLGVNTLILSNAAGGLNRHFAAGDLMLIKDHINCFPENPLRGPNINEWGTRFPNMGNVYDSSLRDKIKSIASEHQIMLQEGVYLGTSGPSYETPAECRFFERIGADAVGMSTVPEAIVAAHGSMRVVAFSVITNVNNPDNFQATSHEEVQSVAEKAGNNLSYLIKELIKQL